MENSEGKIQARKKAMDLLLYRDRSEQELRERLAKAGFAEAEREDALDYVRKFHYLDDERFAFHYIYGRISHTSKRKLFAELRQKGVAGEIVQKAWEKCIEEQEVDERSLLKETILKKVEKNTEIDEKKMRSLMGYLGRRGFSYEDIRSVLEEIGVTLSAAKYEKF